MLRLFQYSNARHFLLFFSSLQLNNCPKLYFSMQSYSLHTKEELPFKSLLIASNSLFFFSSLNGLFNRRDWFSRIKIRRHLLFLSLFIFRLLIPAWKYEDTQHTTLISTCNPEIMQDLTGERHVTAAAAMSLSPRSRAQHPLLLKPETAVMSVCLSVCLRVCASVCPRGRACCLFSLSFFLFSLSASLRKRDSRYWGMIGDLKGKAAETYAHLGHFNPASSL